MVSAEHSAPMNSANGFEGAYSKEKKVSKAMKDQGSWTTSLRWRHSLCRQKDQKVLMMAVIELQNALYDTVIQYLNTGCFFLMLLYGVLTYLCFRV